jgi:hypothetical protein
MVPTTEYTRRCVLQMEAPDGAFNNGIHPMVYSESTPTPFGMRALKRDTLTPFGTYLCTHAKTPEGVLAL